MTLQVSTLANTDQLQDQQLCGNKYREDAQRLRKALLCASEDEIPLVQRRCARARRQCAVGYGSDLLLVKQGAD